LEPVRPVVELQVPVWLALELPVPVQRVQRHRQ
jgi:hypothetical protein